MFSNQVHEFGFLVQIIVSTVFLNYALRQRVPNWLESRFGHEVAQFILLLGGLLCMWMFFGLLAFVPVLGDILGSNWIPHLMARVTLDDPIRALSGLLFCAAWIASLTLISSARLLVYRGRPPLAPAARWAILAASFYLSTLCLDGLRLCFSLEASTAMTAALLWTPAAYLGTIAASFIADARLQARGINIHGLLLTQIIGSIMAATLLGKLIENGSVHLSPLNYALFFSELTSSLPGILVLVLTSFGIVVAMRSSRTQAKGQPTPRQNRDIPSAL